MRLLVMLLLAILPLAAEERSWRSANGNRSFRAEFVSSDGSRVTLRRSDQSVLEVPLTSLHPDDRAFVRDQLARFAEEKEARQTNLARDGMAFGPLEFGDDRETVEAKLKESPLVAATLDPSLIGRTGLNGVFQTRVGEMTYALFFHWTDNGELREVTLRSRPVAAGDYERFLKEKWSEQVALLREIHHDPVQDADYPKKESLRDGHLLGSHLWHTDEKHSVLLCTGQEGSGYVLAIRLSSETIPPNKLDSEELPEEEPASGRPPSP